MLKLSIRDIPPEGKERTVRLEPAWFMSAMTGVEGGWDQAAGEVALKLSRTGGEVLARGDLTARFTVPCARCLEPATVEVAATFATTFVPAGAGSEPLAEAEDSPDVLTYTGDEIDLGDLLREQVILGIPISALCRPDCKGLCPQCGAELNCGPCGCQPPGDPRWDALKERQPH